MPRDRSLPPTAGDLLRFIKAARESRDHPIQHLASFHRTALQEIAGPWHATVHDANTRKPSESRPYSPLGETVRTFVPHLRGDKIMPTVEPDGLGDRGAAGMLEMRLRQWMDDAEYDLCDEHVTIDSMITAGVSYVARKASGTPIAVAGQTDTIDVGQPMVKRIPIGNMVVDPSAETWANPAGIGHFYPVDRQVLLAQGIGDPDQLRQIPNIWQKPKEMQDSGKATSTNEDAYLQDLILLWELCFQHAGRWYCCTLPPMDGPEFFVVPPYEITDEPEGNRYVVTALSELPGHLTPVSPAMAMMDAHFAQAGIAAKLLHQIATLERKYIFAPGAQDMVMRLMNGPGDEPIMGDPSKIAEFIRGGMVKELVDGWSFLTALGQRIGPNQSLAAGQQTPGDSATADSILAGQGAVAIGYWKGKRDAARVKELRRVAAMLTQGNDRHVFKVPGANGSVVPLVWDMTTRDISYDRYKYRIKPSSYNGGMDPRAYLRSLFEVLSSLPGVLQLVVGMGGDPQKALRVISDLANMPELDEMMPTADHHAMQMGVLQLLATGGKIATPNAGGVTPSGAMGGGPTSGVGQLLADMSRRVPA